MLSIPGAWMPRLWTFLGVFSPSLHPCRPYISAYPYSLGTGATKADTSYITMRRCAGICTCEMCYRTVRAIALFVGHMSALSFGEPVHMRLHCPFGFD